MCARVCVMFCVMCASVDEGEGADGSMPIRLNGVIIKIKINMQVIPESKFILLP